jgi:hypothetical protein
MGDRRQFIKFAGALPLAAAAGQLFTTETSLADDAATVPARMAQAPFLFGIHVPDNTVAGDLPRAEELAGRRADVALVFGRLDAPGTTNISALQQAGYEVVLCLEWWDRTKRAADPRYSLAEIASGRHDDAAAVWWRLLRDLPAPIHLRPLHEGNGDWYPWGAYSGTNRVADYVPAFRRVVESAWSIAGRAQIRVQWCVNRLTISPAPVPFATFHPGDDYVDEYVVNGYNRPEWSRSRPFEELLRPAYDELKSLSPLKPFWIGETASTERRGDKAAWIDAMFRSLRSTFVVDVLTWFHERVSPRGQLVRDWPFDSSPAALAAFQRGVQLTRGVGAG